MSLSRPAPADTGERLLAALRDCDASRYLSIRISTSTPRTRRSIAELVQAHAFAAHCRVSLAETRGIAVRWVDGIVSGTPEQLAAFVETVSPVLVRSHGQASIAA